MLRRDLDSLRQRHGPDIDHVKANWAIYVRRYDDTRAGSRHREPCPNRRRPQHQHSGAHPAPPVGTNRALALHLQPRSRRGGAGRQAGPARRGVDRLRPGAIDAHDHRSPCRVARHAGQWRRTVSWDDAHVGRPLHRPDGVRDGRAPASARGCLSLDLVRSPRRRLAGCAGPARQAVGSAGTGSRPGAADPAGSHSPPVNRSARSATPAARHAQGPRASRSRRPSPGSSRTSFRRCTATNWRIART